MTHCLRGKIILKLSLNAGVYNKKACRKRQKLKVVRQTEIRQQIHKQLYLRLTAAVFSGWMEVNRIRNLERCRERENVVIAHAVAQKPWLGQKRAESLAQVEETPERDRCRLENGFKYPGCCHLRLDLLWIDQWGLDILRLISGALCGKLSKQLMKSSAGATQLRSLKS